MNTYTHTSKRVTVFTFPCTEVSFQLPACPLTSHTQHFQITISVIFLKHSDLYSYLPLIFHLPSSSNQWCNFSRDSYIPILMKIAISFSVIQPALYSSINRIHFLKLRTAFFNSALSTTLCPANVGTKLSAKWMSPQEKCYKTREAERTSMIPKAH